MPIEIKEINVRIRIEEGKAKARPAEARPASTPLSEKERREIVRECVEEALRQLRRRG